MAHPATKKKEFRSRIGTIRDTKDGRIEGECGAIIRYTNPSKSQLRYISVRVESKTGLDRPDKSSHRSADLRRFLEGHSHKKRGKERDSQQQKFYDAVRSAGVKDEALSFGSLKECAAVVYNILKSRAWQRRYDVRAVWLKPGYGMKVRGRAQRMEVYPDRISLPRAGRNLDTILHELVHLTVPDPHPGHGRLFAVRYLEMIALGIGRDVGRRLRESYRKHGVKYTPRPGVPEKYKS